MNSHARLTACRLLRLPFAAAAALLIATGAARAADYPTTILGDNAVAYYRFEELPGDSIAVDSGPNSLDAAYTFATNNQPELGLPGIDTNSIGFSSESDSSYGSADIPFNPLLSPTTSDGIHGAAFSVECWAQCYSANDGGAYLSIVGMFGVYGSGTYANASGWLLGTTPGPGANWLFNMKNAGFLNVGTVVPLQWTYLVGTFDGTNQYFYIDGQLAARQNGVGVNYVADNGSDGMIGVVPNAGLPPYGPWDGGLDELAFYTNALTPAQIENHYQIGTNSFRIVKTAPGIISEPSAETNFSGTDVSFAVTANGTGPLSYQWFELGVGPIAGATNSIYTFVSQYPADNNANFYVVISNSVGTTNSTTNSLTVQTNLNVIGAPFPITRTVGSHAAFRIGAGGAEPIIYQWYVSSNNGTSFTVLPGQTADTLWLTNVQMTASGNQYEVVAANPFTAVTNEASLNVNPRTETVPLTGYGAIVAADNPVAYYRLNEPSGAVTAVDAVGSFDGSYDTNSGPIVWGIAPGIPNDTDPAVDLQDMETTNSGLGGTVQIPYALELNPFGAWSMEAWVRPDSVDGAFRVPISSMYNLNSGNNVYGWLIYEFGSIPSFFTMVLYSGNSEGGFYTDFNFNPAAGQWYHLVITDDGTTANFYANAVVGGTVSIVAANYKAQGVNGDPSLAAANEVMGQRSDLAYNGGNCGMDDVAFYNYALTQAQVTQHYLNKAGLTLTQVGSSNVLTYSAGKLLSSPTVNGPYTPVSGATSPYTIPTTGSQQFYQVEVTQ